MSRKNNNEFSYEKRCFISIYFKESKNKIDYFVFGHITILLQKIDKNCIYVNLGEWLKEDIMLF